MQPTRWPALCTLPIAIALLPTLATAGSVFDLTVRGASCKQNSQGSLICRYVVGSDLELSITAAGEADTGVSFLRSNIKGDYFARFGVAHGCVIVAEGGATAKVSAGPSDYAFISPKNGRVYRTWQECKASKP
jgi:hypothetical protein